MPEPDWPMLPVSRTCSTTRLITLGVFGRGGDPARDVLLRLADALRRGAARLVLAFFFDERLAAAFFPLRRFDEAFFFDDLERFDEDFVERFLEEDRFLDAMRFLLFLWFVQSGLM
jgi:hypothetical protein